MYLDFRFSDDLRQQLVWIIKSPLYSENQTGVVYFKYNSSRKINFFIHIEKELFSLSLITIHELLKFLVVLPQNEVW